jgi:hypothetical protein
MGAFTNAVEHRVWPVSINCQILIYFLLLLLFLLVLYFFFFRWSLTHGFILVLKIHVPVHEGEIGGGRWCVVCGVWCGGMSILTPIYSQTAND